MLCTDVADQQSAVPLVQVTQQLGAALVALMNNIRARFENHRGEELRVRLAEVPDPMDAAVRPDAGRIHEGAWDDHAGVRHGRDVTRYPNVPLRVGICNKRRNEKKMESRKKIYFNKKKESHELITVDDQKHR